jgi:hypothetical protein
MKTNTPSADALMSSIRNQFPRESEEQHRKRFIEMVRNGDWKIREESPCQLGAVHTWPVATNRGAAKLWSLMEA